MTAPWDGIPAVDPDPIDAVTARGWRVVWVPDLGEDVWVITECRVILVDADAPRHVAARVILEDLNAHP